MTEVTRLEFDHDYYRLHCLIVDIIECVVFLFILIE